MKTQLKLGSFLFITVMTTLFFFGCKKENSQSGNSHGQQNVSIYLTDDPALFDKVLIDILSVQVQVDTCNHKGENDQEDNHDDADSTDHDGDHHDGDHQDEKDDSCVIWKTLDIRPGVYDLLTLRNGMDTLLAGGVVPAGEIKKIKIALGTNNSLVKDSIVYPLNLPTGVQPFIIVKMKGGDWDEFQPGRSRLWLDFDVARSIRQINNMFYLNPVIHFFTVNSTGSIQGDVGPRESLAVISVYSSNDTAYAIPRHDGEFKIRGLKEGSYTVFINGSNGYQDTTINNVNVTIRHETDLGKITLRH
jgi:hypothetical protein